MRGPSLALASALVLLGSAHRAAAAFTFSYSAPLECGEFQVTWKGGKSPFSLTIIPSFNTPKTYAIPDNAFADGKGTYKVPALPWAKGKQIVVVMSDADGFGTGGVSAELPVGSSKKAGSCDTSEIPVDFFYSTNSALAQCRLYTFNEYPNATLPITFTGVVPAGTVFNLSTNQRSFDWKANVKAGTELVFFAVDARGKQGGSIEFTRVGMTDDDTCVDGSSPTTVSNPPTAIKSSTTPKPSNSNGANDETTEPPSSNTATIVGGVVGGLVGAAALLTLLMFFLRRNKGTAPGAGSFVGSGGFVGAAFRKSKRRHQVDLMHDPAGPPTLSPFPMYSDQHSAVPNSSSNLLDQPTAVTAEMSSPYAQSHSQYSQSGYGAQSQYAAQSQYGAPSQFGEASQYSQGQSQGQAAHRSSMYGGTQVSYNAPSTAARRKAAEANASAYPQQPTRYILHTDLEDDLPPPAEDEVIELPPQYTPRHGASAAAAASGSGTGAGNISPFNDPSSANTPYPPQAAGSSRPS